MAPKILRTLGNAFTIAGLVLFVALLFLLSLFAWPDAWLEWLAQYWGVIGQERGGISIFLYIMTCITYGIAFVIGGALALALARRMEKPARAPNAR